MKVAVFFVCIAVCALIAPGESAIECFQCSGAGCEDPYDGPENHVRGGCDHCGKAVITGTGVPGGDGTARSCETVTPLFLGCKSESEGGARAIACFCDEHRCNSGATIYLALSALLSALALKYLL